MYLLVCVSSHTPVTLLSELQCYLSGVSHVPASIYKCIYVYIVYVPIGVCTVAIFIGCVVHRVSVRCVLVKYDCGLVMCIYESLWMFVCERENLRVAMSCLCMFLFISLSVFFIFIFCCVCACQW